MNVIFIYHVQVLQQLAEHQPTLVAVDGNLSDQTLKTVVEACYAKDIPGALSMYFSNDSR